MPIRIMVIDDDQAILGMFEAVLTNAGYAVATHLTGESALAAVDQFQPDLIILDWMFGQQGRALTILERLERHAATATSGIIVASGAAHALRGVEAALQARGIAVLDKPFLLPDLFAAIDRALRAGAPAPQARPATREDERR
jgi:two-component system OmpR family response regulator